MKVTKPKTLREAVRAFLNQDQWQKPGSASTARSHARTLQVLMTVAGDTLSPGDLRSGHYDAVLTKLRAGDNPREAAVRKAAGQVPRKGRSEIALDNDRYTLRAFTRFVHDQGLLSREYNPAGGLKTTKRSVRFGGPPKPILPEDQFPALLDVAGRRHPRDRIVCALGLFLGRRQSDLLTIKIQHVDLDAGKITYFNEKKDQWRTKPILEELEGELRRWLSWLIVQFGALDPDWFLVPARVSTPPGKTKCTGMYPDWPVDPTRPATSVAKDIKWALEGIGFVTTLKQGCHALRRSFACALRERGVDIDDVRAWLDHEDTLTTRIYTRNDPDDSRLMRHYGGKRMFASAVHEEIATGNVVDLTARRRAQKDFDTLMDEIEDDEEDVM